MTPPDYADIPSPIGTFRIFYQGSKVSDVDLLGSVSTPASLPPEVVRHRAPFPAESPPRQLQAYFRGTRSDFEVEPVPDSNSTFDRAVWKALCVVPAGQTVTYGELARRAGFPGATRAVGGAMHRNSIPIVVPCHRVVGTGGAITGFGLGLWRKRWLLDHEGSWPLRSGPSAGPPIRAQRTLDCELAPPSGVRPTSKASK